MPYDGLVTKNICNELSSLLLGGKIDKIIQPNKDETLLFIRNNRTTYKLLLSANAENARTHITEIKNIENPSKPFNFCMVLRKYLLGAKLKNIFQPNNDRIINFTFENSNELGDKETKILIIEMMGKHSNIILTTETNTIIDSIRHVDFEISRVREVMPGRKYQLPPSQNKLNPFLITKNEYDNTINSRNKLSSNFTGICTFISNTVNNLSFDDFLKFINHKAEPVVFLENNTPKDFYFMPLDINYNIKKFDFLSQAIDCFYAYKLESQKIESAKNELTSIVSKLVTKYEKNLEIINKKLDSAKDIENIRIEGELLSANLYKIKPYDNKIILDNYYTGKSTTIQLNPNLTASGNLQNIFKKYNKLKNTQTACLKQKEEITSHLNYFESLFYEIYTQKYIEDLEEIKLELMEQGIIKKNIKKQKELPSRPLEFEIGNYKVLIGKNNIQNDKLTFHIASKNDIWFHVKNAPGSHTILRLNNIPINNVSYETLNLVASLAAYHSKLKNSPKVEVDYTQVKNVKKIPGAKPGMVIYDNYKTLYVEPNDKA